MDKRLNWGLLSTAKINRALIKPLNASKRTRLLAVASRSISSAEAYAREWNIPRAHGSYEALLADPEIDVIYNSLPNHLHAEWTIKALRAGKHVLCEKPFALTLAEVDAMSQAAHETGKVLAEAFMYLHHAQTLKIKEIVESGVLGKLQLIKGAFTFTLTREGNYRWMEEMGGGSIRMHRSELQDRLFAMLGMSKEEAHTQFGHLLEAFQYGAPPHGGIALGIDRVVALFAETTSIRDVIAFPKTAAGTDLMLDTPSPVTDAQLAELHIALRATKASEAAKK